MTIEEISNILLQDYRLRAENDYLNTLNDIYIERINKAIEFIEHLGYKGYAELEKLLDILKGDNNE